MSFGLGYVLVGTTFGRYWKYIVVSLFFFYVLYLIIYFNTDSTTLGIIGSGGAFILFYFYLMRKEKSVQGEEKFEEEERLRKNKEYVDVLEMKKNECMSCRTEIEQYTICESCGFDNSTLKRI